ncbi:MAG: chromate transporter [Bacteroidaceae bacterium]|nr:chromate transporter [Bacteroidaceae bacterium]
MAIFIELFYSFFKIGLFSFGGGYGMLSVIQGEVVTRHAWMNMSEFTDIVAVSQMTPGPIGINTATYVGYTAVINSGGSQVMAVLGSLISSFAVMLPSFILMLLISRFFMKYCKHPRVEVLFSVLRPTVVGLIASAALLLMNSENFGLPTINPIQFIVSVTLFVFTFIAVKKYKFSPILTLIACGVLGALFYGLFPIN